MHLLYTLIASGLLFLVEIPAEQPPPPIPIHTVTYSGENIGATQQTAALTEDGNLIDISFDYTGGWNVSSSSITDLGTSARSYPTEFEQNKLEAQQAPQAEGVALAQQSEVLPVDAMVTPTAMPKDTAVPVASPSDDALVTYGQQSALPITGYAMFYNPNVMSEVMNNRLAMGHISPCGECVGNVALLRAGDLNRRVWLQWADGVIEGPFLVVDAAATQHVTQLLARKWVVDVDHGTAVRRKMAGPVMVTVWGSPPPASQQNPPPFAPLYSVLPAASPDVTSVLLLLQTPVPTAVAMPSPAVAQVAPGAVAQGGFPTETPVPTTTPLPAVSADLVAATGEPEPWPTNVPAPTQTSQPTATPTASPMPTVIYTPVVNVVMKGGFPTETPVPTITPLPAINVAALATVAPTQTSLTTATTMLSPTIISSPTLTPTATLVPSMTGVVVTHQGFPTDTPVPTITPLPAINPLPSPTPNPN